MNPQMKTIGDILVALGSKKPFLNDVIHYADGTIEPFTKKGAKTYSKLIEILYTVGKLTNTDMNDIVEELDSIVNQDY